MAATVANRQQSPHFLLSGASGLVSGLLLLYRVSVYSLEWGTGSRQVCAQEGGDLPTLGKVSGSLSAGVGGDNEDA